MHALLYGVEKDTILEGSPEADVPTYTERAWELAKNLNDLADILERKKIEDFDATT